MKLAVKVVIAAAVLQSSAHAAEKAVAADATEQRQDGKVASAQHATRSGKHSRIAGKKSGKPANPEISAPETTSRQEEVTETPPATIEQTVQLKGVRG